METQTPESPRIGVFNMPMIVKGEGPTNREPSPARDSLIIVGDNLSPPPSEPPAILDAHGEAIPSITWPEYIAWRKTKCRPFDYENDPSQATKLGPDLGIPFPRRDRALEEIDQATHELVGEVAELGELLTAHGLGTFYGQRSKLIDEIGDIFFCANWALDAWGRNPLADAPGLELIEVAEDSLLVAMAGVLAMNPEETVAGNAGFVATFGNVILRNMLVMQTNAGLTCNSFKKLRFQRREQKVEVQVERILTTLALANEILVLANSSVEEALKVNMRKINARYPNGHTEPSGGIRTGDGK